MRRFEQIRIGLGTLMAAGTLAAAVAAGTGTAWSLAGTLTLRGATIVDAPPGERADTHASFLVEGDAARGLYEALRGPAGDDPCEGGGGRIKRAGHLACSRSADGTRYECDFAIDLEHGTITTGRVC
jgi:hypothetical protein